VAETKAHQIKRQEKEVAKANKLLKELDIVSYTSRVF